MRYAVRPSNGSHHSDQKKRQQIALDPFGYAHKTFQDFDIYSASLYNFNKADHFHGDLYSLFGEDRKTIAKKRKLLRFAANGGL